MRSFNARNGKTWSVCADKPSSGFAFASQTKFPGLRKGSGRMSTVRKTLKTVEHAPIPRAIMTMAKKLKPGSRRIMRSA